MLLCAEDVLRQLLPTIQLQFLLLSGTVSDYYNFTGSETSMVDPDLT